MARGNRNLQAKYERSVRQRIEAGFLEQSKDGFRSRPMSCDKRVFTVERLPVKPLAMDEAAAYARLARAKSALSHCTIEPRTFKGRRVLEAR